MSYMFQTITLVKTGARYHTLNGRALVANGELASFRSDGPLPTIRFFVFENSFKEIHSTIIQLIIARMEPA